MDFVDSFNLYAFNGFDPVNFFDPLGLSSSSLSGAKQNHKLDGATVEGSLLQCLPERPQFSSSFTDIEYSNDVAEFNRSQKVSAFSDRLADKGDPGGIAQDGIAIPVAPSDGAGRPQLSILPSKLDRMSPQDITTAIRRMTPEDLERISEHLGEPMRMVPEQARAVRDGLLERNIYGDELTPRQRAQYVNEVLLENYFEKTDQVAANLFRTSRESSLDGLEGQVIGAGVGLGLRSAKGIGRGGNKLSPDPRAEGPHSTFKRDPKTGSVTGHAEWDAQGNPVKRTDIVGADHGPVKTPHTHEYGPPNVNPTTGNSYPGNEVRVRPATPDEIPLWW